MSRVRSLVPQPGPRAMKVHLMGIGGAGVSALARVFLARGDSVSGCDLKASATTQLLEAEGVGVAVGHDPAHVRGLDLLVYSGAVRSGAEELEAARVAGVRVVARAQMLAELIDQSEGVAVAGTHGKTTVTHMLGQILTAAGYDPTVLVGDGSSARAGHSRWLVAEADESDGTLVLHHPRHALLTNVELDHADHFASVGAVVDLFAEFLAGLPAGGTAVVCADDRRASALTTRARRVTYGFAPEATYRCTDERPFVLSKHGDELGRVRLGVPGRHNVQNATGAAAMAIELGVPFETVAAALKGFSGAHRRLERLGSWRGASIYDDYGHHPTEVAATLAAARELGPRRLLVVFQPHRFSRLRALLDDFAGSFSLADVVLITDVYAAGEENPTNVHAADLAERVPGARWVPDFTAAREALEQLGTGKEDLVLVMGAGDIWRLGHELANGA